MLGMIASICASISSHGTSMSPCWPVMAMPISMPRTDCCTIAVEISALTRSSISSTCALRRGSLASASSMPVARAASWLWGPSRVTARSISLTFSPKGERKKPANAALSSSLNLPSSVRARLACMAPGSKTSRTASDQTPSIAEVKGTGWSRGAASMTGPNWVKISSSAVARINSAVVRTSVSVCCARNGSVAAESGSTLRQRVAAMATKRMRITHDLWSHHGRTVARRHGLANNVRRDCGTLALAMGESSAMTGPAPDLATD